MDMSSCILRSVLVMFLFSVVGMASDFIGEQKSFAVTTVRKPGRQQRDALKEHPFTKKEQDEIVGRHNELRRQVEPPASNMQHMFWHDELAHMAQTWAESCVWEHGQPDHDLEEYGHVGQNMWRGRHDRVVNAVNSWYNEYRFYDFERHDCTEGKQCGHYIQEVWFRTKHVGCGFHDCEDEGWTLIVCNYGPPGNYKGQQPYKVGVECSECPVPSWCYEGLCMPDCKDLPGRDCDCLMKCEHCGIRHKNNCTCTCETGWAGPYCSDKCDNTDKRCHNGWYRNWCDRSFVLNKCPKMCDKCESLEDYSKQEQCCDGMECENGGYLNAATCTCECNHMYSGKYCEILGASTSSTQVTSIVMVLVAGLLAWQSQL